MELKKKTKPKKKKKVALALIEIESRMVVARRWPVGEMGKGW